MLTRASWAECGRTWSGSSSIPVPVTIETIPALEGQNVNDVPCVATGRRQSGIYILLAQREHKISNILIPGHLKNRLSERRLLEARDAFTENSEGRLQRRIGPGYPGDRGAMLSVAAAEAGRPWESRRRRGSRAPEAGPDPPCTRRAGRPVGQVGAGSGLGLLIMIGLVIVAVLIGLDSWAASSAVPAALSRANRRWEGRAATATAVVGAGASFSSLRGHRRCRGGNWLYDQFSGRHRDPGGYQGSSSYDPGASPPSNTGNDEIVGADYGGGQGGDWVAVILAAVIGAAAEVATGVEVVAEMLVEGVIGDRRSL
jgi:hypothetical protein